MDHAFSELPLALFSTLAPLGAGAFIMLAVAFLTGALRDASAKIKMVDRLTFIPLLLVIAGFIAATFHLTTPLNALSVIAGVGRSPLSNEVFVGGIFTLVALVYWIFALTGKLKMTVRKILVAATGILALIFALFMGLAYTIPTIPSWDSPFSSIAMLGYCLLGGGLFGLLILQIADTLIEVSAGTFKTITISLSAVGVLAAIIGIAGQYLTTQGLEIAEAQAAAVLPWMIAGIIGLLLAFALAVLPIVRKPHTGMVALGCVMVLGAVFAGRMVFYALYLTVGM